MSKPPFEKFADDYASSRPGYPDEIKSFLFNLFDVDSNSCIADIACGSGIFTQLLSCERDSGCVVGLDHSLPLLMAGMGYFEEFCFKPLCGSCEILALKSNWFDLVTVAQGFHWMNRQESLAEINRILKPGGGIALVWYRRKTLTKPHQAFIERLTHKYN
ncbi:MAG: class I SAM-dependent methyltransferase, partial [candidate division Zixibacteria bacterium]